MITSVFMVLQFWVLKSLLTEHDIVSCSCDNTQVINSIHILIAGQLIKTSPFVSLHGGAETAVRIEVHYLHIAAEPICENK